MSQSPSHDHEDLARPCLALPAIMAAPSWRAGIVIGLASLVVSMTVGCDRARMNGRAEPDPGPSIGICGRAADLSRQPSGKRNVEGDSFSSTRSTRGDGTNRRN
jgi:hypothetical protein